MLNSLTAMNSTELDVRYEKCLVSTVIFYDKSLAKRATILPIFSILFDSFSDFYAPIFIVHRGLLYSNSFLARSISFGQFLTIELGIMGQIGFAYLACVYYRRGVVLTRDRFFNLFGWRRIAFFVSVQAYLIITLAIMLHFYKKSIEASELSMPSEFLWITKKNAYLFLPPESNLQYARYASDSAGIICSSIILIFIGQLILEVKRGMHWTSKETRRYQQLAVCFFCSKSVSKNKIEGAIPSMVYLIPGYSIAGLQFSTKMFAVGEKFDQFATILSPILWIIFTKHGFVSSLTILYCSPSYRKKIVAVITTSRNSVSRELIFLVATSWNERTI
ncbi:hypothetical protein PRIPAC_79243 [Pristionchus pacificus]|uniref:Uncharacterized protein n=1 Tax=Pristionchus pacificus TaxID=54126 RepID=A0A2A6CKL7_PRIPA|nr:hypothetical protein PRIPAC_79243 [Pristionchus pacificus]|eukprot:PDM78571.1 hypothetical protein PRIPAC_31150 [Pristionchus pacificus]